MTKPDLQKLIVCLNCGHGDFELHSQQEMDADQEIRAGSLHCPRCGQEYEISNGIVNLLLNPSPDVLTQQQITIDADKHSKHEGGGFEISRENINLYRKQFLTLPEGDGSGLYTHGAFKNISGLARQYYDFVDKLALTGEERVLEIGADSCWSVAKFAQMGCECVATDINHHLIVSDLFMDERQIYFERVLADMNRLPFKDKIFDVVFCSQVLHHSPDLSKALGEISRVLKPGGRLALFSEPMFGQLLTWRKLFFGYRARRMGVNERIYSMSQWLSSMRQAGLSPELHFTLHQRYERIEKYLFPFRNELVKSLLTKSKLYSRLVLEPYKADVIAYKTG